MSRPPSVTSFGINTLALLAGLGTMVAWVRAFHKCTPNTRSSFR